MMAQAAFRHGMQAHGGAIVNIVAEMWRGFPGMAHSGAARAGVVNLTQTLALEWARYGIHVNAVAPGIIDSSGLKTYPEAVRAGWPASPARRPQGAWVPRARSPRGDFPALARRRLHLRRDAQGGRRQFALSPAGLRHPRPRAVGGI